MMEWNEEYEEDFEYTEDFDEDIDEDFEYTEEFDEQIDRELEEGLRCERIEEIKTHKEIWAKDLGNIEDPELQAKEIEAAEKMIEKRQDLEKKLDSGEITKDQFNDEIEFGIRRKEARATTRFGLASVGITWDDIGDAMDELADLRAGNLETMEEKKTFKKYIELAGDEASQEIIDRALEEGKIDEDMHKSFSRYVRLN